jgi:metal-responsive CopG/Arc/MetJ family transcriptional regulator
METIQIVLDRKLLAEADRVGKRLQMNRSALFRVALREHLRRLQTLELERRDREGYENEAERPEESAVFERVAKWPDE